MNPKGTSNLDPKLRETYERVMGTNVPVQPVQAAPPVQPVTPPQAVSSEELPPPPPPQPQQPMFTASPVPSDPPVADSSPEMVQSPQVFKAQDPFAAPPAPPADVLAKNATVNPSEKKENKMMPALLGIGGVVFFVAYAAIWAKVFGLF